LNMVEPRGVEPLTS